jgi:hypothetical protein
MAEKKKGIKYTTPKGIAQHPRLTEPDTKFVPTGVFSVKLRLSAEEAAPLMAIMDTLAEETYQETKAKLEEKPSDPKKIAAQKKSLAALTLASPGYTMDCDDEGEENGNVIFSFKMNHVITKADGTTTKIYPKLFDAKGVAIKGKPAIFGGSELKISCTANGYYTAGTGKAGASLRLNAVQIIKLVSGGGTAEGFGFSEEEGGYEDDTSATPQGFSDSDSSDASAPQEDF